MKTVIKHFILIGALLLLAACTKPYKLSDSGSIVTLSEDDWLEIVLEADLNSGFKWQLDANPQFIELEKPVLKINNGTIETYNFKFKTISQGADVIRLIYTDGRDIEKTFELKVLIGEMGLIEE